MTNNSLQVGQAHETFLPYMLNVFLPFQLAVHYDPKVPYTLFTSNVHSFVTICEVVTHISPVSVLSKELLILIIQYTGMRKKSAKHNLKLK